MGHGADGRACGGHPAVFPSGSSSSLALMVGAARCWGAPGGAGGAGCRRPEWCAPCAVWCLCREKVRSGMDGKHRKLAWLA